jgi:hypothetical protein
VRSNSPVLYFKMSPPGLRLQVGDSGREISAEH